VKRFLEEGRAAIKRRGAWGCTRKDEEERRSFREGGGERPCGATTEEPRRAGSTHGRGELLLVAWVLAILESSS
jgi:hypothetical protein